ncbi:hypothetical protein MASR2M78_14450 [Treponema sp.]
MANDTANPLIVQSDKTLLLDVHAPRAEDARSAIMPFAELEKSPEHIHTYRITPLSLWNAASAGLSPDDVEHALIEYSRYAVPQGIVDGFSDIMSRYGKIRMVALPPPAPLPEPELEPAAELPAGAEKSEPNRSLPEELLLVTSDKAIRAEIGASRILAKYILPFGEAFKLPLTHRGTVKRELIKLGWPVKDEAPLAPGEPLEVKLSAHMGSGKVFAPRDYQTEAARSVVGDGRRAPVMAWLSSPAAPAKRWWAWRSCPF